jgi:hypothetical protein
MPSVGRPRSVVGTASAGRLEKPDSSCRCRGPWFDALVEQGFHPVETAGALARTEGDTPCDSLSWLANEETKAGVLLAGEGLQASSKGARVHSSGGKPTVASDPSRRPRS